MPWHAQLDIPTIVATGFGLQLYGIDGVIGRAAEITHDRFTS
jgi:hypothetical protein